MQSMTIGKKLLISTALMLTLTLVLGIAGIYNVNRLGTSVDELGQHYARELYLAGSADHLTADMLGKIRGMLLRALSNDQVKARDNYDQYLADMPQMRQDTQELIALSGNPELKRIAQQQVLDSTETLNSLNATVSELVFKGKAAEALSFYTEKSLPLAKSIGEASHQLTMLAMQESTDQAAADRSMIPTARYLDLSLLALAALASFFMITVVRGISAALAENISELREGAEQVTSAAAQVAGASHHLAQGASEQAASLEETSASSEEINSMAEKNTVNSRSTVDLLKQSHTKVNLANEHLHEMVTSMNDINSSSEKISKIIKVIDEIAFQTNILALNAAVEAARAGEAGMGFAVVADEVRSLAQRSAKAAKDTAGLIEDSIAKSAEGKGKVDQVASAIVAITEDTTRVRVMVDEVNLGSEEQSRGIDQIRRAVSQMEQVTQRSAASAEECAAAAEQLSAQAEAMKDAVGRLQTMVGSSENRSFRSAVPTSIHPSFKPAPMVASKSSGTLSSKSPHRPSPPKSMGRPATPNSQRSAKTSKAEEEFSMEGSFEAF